MYNNYPDNYYEWDGDSDPHYIHIDKHQDIIGDLQNIIDRAKEELINVKKVIELGDLKKIEEALEEVYGYLEG